MGQPAYERLVRGARDWSSMLRAAEVAFDTLYQPLRDTQRNDVPVKAASLALAARAEAMRDVKPVLEAARHLAKLWNTPGQKIDDNAMLAATHAVAEAVMTAGWES